MKNTALFLSFFFSFALGAQVVIDHTHMPEAGDIYPFANALSAGGNDHSFTGEGVTWDYTMLEALTYDADTFVTVEQTPFAYQFFFNNDLLYPDYVADYCLAGPDVDFGFVMFTDTYSYFKSDEDGLRDVGDGATVSGLPTSVRNEPIDWIYEFPLMMADSFSGFSASEQQLPGVGYIYNETERFTEVEGWGTLILPDATYEVLKVKVTLNTLDTVYVDFLMNGFTFEQEGQVTYQWISPDEISPVLEVTIGDFGDNARFRANPPPMSIGELTDIGASVFPNPAAEFLSIQGIEIGSKVSLVEMSGRIVAKELAINSSFQMDVSNLRAGAYILIVENERGRWNQKLIIH